MSAPGAHVEAGTNNFNLVVHAHIQRLYWYMYALVDIILDTNTILGSLAIDTETHVQPSVNYTAQIGPSVFQFNFPSSLRLHVNDFPIFCNITTLPFKIKYNAQ